MMDEAQENRFHITHPWLGMEHTLDVVYVNNRLELMVNGKDPQPGQKIYLTEEETADFLAWIRSLSQHEGEESR